MFNNDLFSIQGKRCPYCGRILDYSRFCFSRYSRDGMQSYCKDCQKEYKERNPGNQYKKNRKDKSLSIW